jgi:hypothetical protein
MRLTDTSAEVEQVVREAYRRMPFARKWAQLGAIYDTARVLHAARVRERQPTATVADVAAAWRESVPHAGRHVLPRSTAMLGQPENLRVVGAVVAILTNLGIPYALGGSWASSLLGKMRFTYDADLSVEPFPGKEEAFCAAFGEDYYVSLPAVRQANRQRGSFNVVHTPSAFKVDVFVQKDRPFDRAVMARRRAYPLPEGGQEIVCVSAEDVILLKLEWYRLGGEASQRQWEDVQGVLQVQADRLDRAYLDTWAADLGVADLLARARQEAGV